MWTRSSSLSEFAFELRNLTHQIWVGNFRVNRWWFVIRDRESTRFNLLEVTSPDIRGEVCHSRIVAGHWRLGADHVRLLFAVVNHFTVQRLGSDQLLSLKVFILNFTANFWSIFDLEVLSIFHLFTFARSLQIVGKSSEINSIVWSIPISELLYSPLEHYPTQQFIWDSRTFSPVITKFVLQSL